MITISSSVLSISCLDFSVSFKALALVGFWLIESLSVDDTMYHLVAAIVMCRHAADLWIVVPDGDAVCERQQ